MKVEILSPEAEVWSGEAQSVRAPGREGSLGILPRHLGLILVLGSGPLFVQVSGVTKEYKVTGGILEVHSEGVRVLSEDIIPKS